MPSKKSVFNKETHNLKLLLYDYKDLKRQLEFVTSQLEAAKTKLKKYVDTNGYETPEGHKLFDVDNSESICNQVSNRAKLNENAIDILKVILPRETIGDVISKVEVVDEERLKKLILDNKIPLRIASKLYTTTKVVSFTIRENKHEE